MDATVKQKNGFRSSMAKIGSSIDAFFHNQTFLYIVKRILSSLLTLVLLIAVVTALIRMMPDTKFYDTKTFQKYYGQNKQMAINWRNHQLYLYGRVDINGNPRSVFYSIFQYIYWILPIPKIVPLVWSDWTCQIVTKSFVGTSYFGQSITYSAGVTDLLGSRIGISMLISLLSTFFAYLCAIPLGIAMAKKPGGIVDKIGNVFVVLNYAIPAIVFYLIMNQWLGLKNSTFGWADFGLFYDENKWWSLVPPIFCIAFLSIPGVIIWIRRYMVDELGSDYVKFARSKGLSERKIMYTHVLRNACVPLVRNLPAVFLGSIVGSYYVETIWNIPGTGALLVTALQGTSPDVQLIQGLTVIYAALSMVAFLLGDIITVMFDPRIKLASD